MLKKFELFQSSKAVDLNMFNKESQQISENELPNTLLLMGKNTMGGYRNLRKKIAKQQTKLTYIQK